MKDILHLAKQMLLLKRSTNLKKYESPGLQNTFFLMKADVLTKMSVQSALQENTELTCSTSTAETPTDSYAVLRNVTEDYSFFVCLGKLFLFYHLFCQLTNKS